MLYNDTRFEKALEILNKLNVIRAGSSAIMGGCLRDQAFGVKIKDIDIVTNLSEAEILSVIAIYKEEVIVTDKTSCSGSSAYKSGTQDRLGTCKDIQSVLYVEFKDGSLPIDFIVCKVEPMERLRLFPCNLSMIYTFDGKSVHQTNEFKLTDACGVIHFYPTCTPEYKERMLAKYPDLHIDVDLSM